MGMSVGESEPTGIIKLTHYEPLGRAAHVMMNCGRNKDRCEHYRRGTTGTKGEEVGRCEMKDRCGLKLRETACGADTNTQDI